MKRHSGVGVILHRLQGGTMLFRKLFRMLVLGGAAIGANAGCSAAQAQQAAEKKQDARAAAHRGAGATPSSDAKTHSRSGGGSWGAPVPPSASPPASRSEKD